MGAITDVVRRYTPRSFRALCSVTNSYYSLQELQAIAEWAQFRLFATVANVDDEATVYDRNERQLLGVVTTLNFIPAAVEYWGEQLAVQGTRGTDEAVTYRDPRPDLWKLFATLKEEARALGMIDTLGVIPKVGYGDESIFVTSDPECWPRAYGRKDNALPDGINWKAPGL